VYFAGKGGTVYYRDNPDSSTGTVTQLAFWGPLSSYTNNRTTYDNNVFVTTPLTVDTQGNVFFGFRVNGSTPANLVSGIAKIAPNGTGTWVSAEAASGGDTNIDWACPNSAPAVSNDGSSLYLAVRNASSATYGRLVALSTNDLST